MPMIAVEIDMHDLEAYAKKLGAAEDQIPFAIALALNRSADVTRNFLIQNTWPQHVNARNTSFIAASLTTKESRADKRSLSVEIYDKLDRGNLLMQATGGTRKPRGTKLAIPSTNVPKGQHGVPKRLRPKNLANAFVKKGLLFTRDRKGKVKLMYTLKSATTLPKRVPFFTDYEASMKRELMRTIPLAVERAMSTRRR
jgi:hypothetical protein